MKGMENIEPDRIALFFVVPMNLVIIGPQLLGFVF
jgi:hypothetical protein